MGTPGQDLNLSMERLTSNKAFTNKLWNARKFMLQNLPSQSDFAAWDALLAYKFDKEDSLTSLPLAECWVVSACSLFFSILSTSELDNPLSFEFIYQVLKLHLLIDLVTMSYDKFYFRDVARETYDFFWAEFAD
ncbi:hypothetical protein Droror1_Dr00002291 [Drosera rotundifolia]